MRLTGQYVGKQSAKNKRLSALEIRVNVVVELQNDLIGLKEDTTRGFKPNKMKFYPLFTCCPSVATVHF